MSEAWTRVLEACRRGLDDCKKALESFLVGLCDPLEVCEHAERRARKTPSYRWIEKLIERGVPDGRARLILYVLSRYLVNVKKLEDEEAAKVIQVFLENSCKNYGNCGKIYQTWVASTLRGVRRGGWKPWSLSRIREKDPELYDIVSAVLGERVEEES
ncbi:MAG: DNA primase noncatalytic subunit PriX [Acidilobaceae archaeon]